MWKQSGGSRNRWPDRPGKESRPGVSRLRRRRAVRTIGGAIAFALLAGGCSTLSGMRNPQVSVPIDHPPGIGVNLAKVVFAPPGGSCSTRLVTAATEELLAAGVEIGTDLVVVASSAEAGEDIPSAAKIPSRILLSLNDTACESQQSSSVRDGERKRKRKNDDGETEEYTEYYTVYSRTTDFDAGVSVRAADLATGEMVGAWQIRERTSDTNTRENAVPDYPSSSLLKDRALRRGSEDLVQWLLPWTESAALTFYDAEECGMGAVYRHLDSDDRGSAHAAAARSIEACDGADVEARFRAATYYNAGILHFMDADHDAALGMFEQAARLDPENKAVQRATEKAAEARGLLGEILRIDALAAVAAAPDLVFESISVALAGAASGTALRLAAAVRNVGGGHSDATTLRWYRLRDDGVAVRDVEIGMAEVAALDPGATSGQAIDVTLGDAGSLYRACIDAVDGESETANNCSRPEPVELPDFALDAANENPQGVARAGAWLYVVDDRNRKVYAYTMDGIRDPGADFDLDEQKVPTGIAGADRRLYVVDWSDDKVYVYTTMGERVPDADFDLASANGSPTGIAHAGGRLYVADSSDDRVYVYTTAGGRAGDFGLDPENRSAAGIAHAGDRLHVVDDRDGKVYAYTTAGERDPDADFVLEQHEMPRGIAGADGVFVVVDSGDDRIRAYAEDGRGL